MILYHGSNTVIDKIRLDLCKPYKDFGRAFYLSEQRNQAEEIAAARVSFFGGEPAVMEFFFDERIISGSKLKVKAFTAYDKEWAEFVFANRDERCGAATHGYDIVYGPIANDRVGLQIRKYRDRLIDLNSFLEALKYIKGVTYQYAFCSQKAIDQLIKL